MQKGQIVCIIEAMKLMNEIEVCISLIFCSCIDFNISFDCIDYFVPYFHFP